MGNYIKLRPTMLILRRYKRGCECASYNRYLYKAWGSGGCFECFNGGFFDAVAVAFPLPYRLSFKYTGSDPARNRCIVYSQTFCYLWRCEIFLFHVRKNVLNVTFSLTFDASAYSSRNRGFRFRPGVRFSLRVRRYPAKACYRPAFFF